MSHYIHVEKKGYIPFKPIRIHFHEKEEVELNAFQKFLLEAMEEDATIEQIIEATQLTKNLILSEVLQMESQKLLVREGDTIALSALSKDILMISKTVERLNDEKKILCINLITGDMEGYDEYLTNDVRQTDYVMEGKIRSGDVVGTSIEDNVSFLADYMSAFGTLSEEQIEKVLSSIYADFDEIDKKIIYKPLVIKKMPCLIGEEESNLEDNAYANGKCSVITIELSTDKIETYKEQIKGIMEIYAGAPELLSDVGRDLASEYERCADYNRQKLTFVYDHTSGFFREEKYNIAESPNQKAQLMLREEKELDSEALNTIYDAAKNKWRLGEDYQLKIAAIEEHIYRVGFCFQELRGESYEEE